MDKISNHIRNHLLENAGVYETKKQPPLEELKKTEWNPEFERLSRNRLVMGAMRYGRLHEKISYDSITSMRQRLDLFEQDGNGEHLVDISNICHVTFTREDHPKFHFKAGDETIHVEKK